MRGLRLFKNRADAGRQLARELDHLRSDDVVVVGLPRGGVPVAYEVARHLEAPLDVCVVRKIGAPMQPELAIGAVAEAGIVHVDHDLTEVVGVGEQALERLIAEKRAEVAARVDRFRGGAPAADVRDKTVVVVDDGVATGSTARVALTALRQRGVGRLVLAVPVGAADTLEALASLADEVVCPHPRSDFWAVGLWYRDFQPTTDDDVVELLARARDARPVESAPSRVTPTSEEVQIPLAKAWLSGDLRIPAGAQGLVLFAHGSGSSRHSVRNQQVAEELGRRGSATLLFDLLTEQEERVDIVTRHLRFDIDLLARRLVAATDWVHRRPETHDLPIGYFGSSTGAAAALIAASERPELVRAVVSRGGRPDLALDALPHVTAPTLLIVGGHDRQVLALNRKAFASLTCEKQLEIVAGATHLFEEPGALLAVARSAAEWFAQHLHREALEQTA